MDFMARLSSKAQYRLEQLNLSLRMKLMNTFWPSDFKRIDSIINGAKPQDIPGLFKNISIDQFGVLLLDVPSRYPNIKNFFPAMPPNKSQDLWTGNHGVTLLAQSLAFIKTLVAEYNGLTHKSISRAQILDFGCGWGRLTRLLYKYVPYEQLYAIDSWEKSIEICRQYGIKANLAVCDTVPSQIPFQKQFDLIFAFSVFTHISEKTATAVLQTLRKYIAADGLLVITIRPKEFWAIHQDGKHQAEMAQIHNKKGFAFIPHAIPAIDGDIPYGDASISLEYIRSHFPQWKLEKTITNSTDPYQTILFLRPA